MDLRLDRRALTEPEEPCGDCAGGATELAFKNVGYPAGVFLEIEDKGGLLFSRFMADGAVTGTLSGSKSDGKFDGDVKIYADGARVASIHTSCSQPIGIGMEFGGFEVISGRSKDGGPFCDPLAGLINEWLLEGVVDSDETFDGAP